MRSIFKMCAQTLGLQMELKFLPKLTEFWNSWSKQNPRDQAKKTKKNKCRYLEQENVQLNTLLTDRV